MLNQTFLSSYFQRSGMHIRKYDIIDFYRYNINLNTSEHFWILYSYVIKSHFTYAEI